MDTRTDEALLTEGALAAEASAALSGPAAAVSSGAGGEALSISELMGDPAGEAVEAEVCGEAEEDEVGPSMEMEALLGDEAGVVTSARGAAPVRPSTDGEGEAVAEGDEAIGELAVDSTGAGDVAGEAVGRPAAETKPATAMKTTAPTRRLRAIIGLFSLNPR